MYRISDEHERTPRMSRPLLTTSFCSSDHRIHTQGSSSIYTVTFKSFQESRFIDPTACCTVVYNVFRFRFN